jgi:dihydrofolate synthase / folylpolyglutamate synthase
MSRIEGIVERLQSLHPRLIDLSLGRLKRLLSQLGNPERRLPPVIHVAGTNGKGSTCAFLRAMAEADGKRVHVYTSPHLVHFNERIRLAGQLVSDPELESTLADIERINGGEPITVFEVITAAAFVLFAKHPADLCILEVGLGGRFDATNVIPAPAACAITSISLDHQEFLGTRLAQIAAEKAGIMKPGIPAATGHQDQEALFVLQEEAARIGAKLLRRDQNWTIAPTAGGLRYQDGAGTLHLPPPALPGTHQIENAGIAIAALRASSLPIAAYAGIARAEWPARLQKLSGRLAALTPAHEVFLDGGHNPGAALVLAQQLRAWADRPLYLVVGMKQTKDAAGFLHQLIPLATETWAVAEPDQHGALPVEAIIAAANGAAKPGPIVTQALRQIANYPPGRVLICGSLYLAGEVLKQD